MAQRSRIPVENSDLYEMCTCRVMSPNLTQQRFMQLEIIALEHEFKHQGKRKTNTIYISAP